jgi:signal transduction histidine kinase/DNA-binding response OmpR family regulator/CHASE3 domain sensor protein
VERVRNFRRILNRNVIWPLVIGLLSAAFFSSIIYYLLSVNRWVEGADVTIRKANQILRTALDRETSLRGFVITGDEDFLEPYQRSKGAIGQELTEVRRLIGEQPEQLRRIDAIEDLARQWSDYSRNVIAIRADGGDAGGPIRSGIGKKLMDAMRVEITAFLDAEEHIKAQRYSGARNVVYLLVGAFLLFSIVVAALLAYWGRRDLLNLAGGYEGILRKQIEHAESLQNQAWLRDAQVQFAEQIAGQLSLSAVCGRALQFLCRHVDAAVGVIYVLERENVLRRAASYAFSTDAEDRRQTFRVGESLVGQAALEGRTLQLHDVPADYIRVSSGLGDALVTCLLVLPVQADHEVNAVLELGFVRKVGERELELLQLLADSLGLAIATANYRQQLQVALWETQQLNEELQSQQEELRAANEELEEQAQAVEEAQSQLEHQHAELARSNERLATQSAVLELQRDTVGRKNAELSHAQQLLEEHARELERASRYKSEFLANMSHELRTPLNSSLILARLLSDNATGNLSAEQVRYAQSIYAAGNDLLELINDILDISKVEAGRLEIRADHVALEKLVESIAASFRPQAQEKGLEFEVVAAADLPGTLFIDQKRLAQILRNLLSNAMKFTERGGRVTLRIESRTDASVAIVVQDSGIGIKPEHQQEIFEAFRQGDGTTNRKYGGTGLGLSISRELARLLGGTLDVESVPDKGSAFTLTIPVAYREPEPATPVASGFVEPTFAAPDLRARPPFEPQPFVDDRGCLANTQRTLLIIEDEPQFAQILYDLAHQQHYNCLVATGADAGFQTALEYLPDAILLDMKLPDHSGLTVLERLKFNSKTRHIPVHIVSVEDYSEVALLLGAVGYLTKPVTREALQHALVDLGQRLDRKVKHVLLVEDDRWERASIEQLIGDTDIEITSVESGEAALQVLCERVFDCMIIDLRLPDMRGAELLQRMTTAEIYSFPPVIVHTAGDLSPADEAELLRYSRSIIIKGARSPERLLDEVMLFLHKVETELPIERQQMLRSVRNRERVFEGRKVLVVDDDVRNIFALTSVLEQKGAFVEVARNGREALELLESSADIDLVLMDIMMPEMDGYEAIERLRAIPRFANLPVIAVTAKAMRDDHERCLRVGANDYLSKPINLDRLLSLIRVWMPRASRF